LKNYIDKFPNFRGSIGFLKTFQKARYLGYIPGLSYQSIPFDFRLSMKSNKIKKIFKPNISRLKKLTSKKVFIIAQSYGNNGVSLELSKMSQDFKTNNIIGWISIAAPFKGTIRSLFGITGGNNAFSLLNTFGFKYSTSVRLMSSFSCMYELIPRNHFISGTYEPWMEWIEKRYLFNIQNPIRTGDDIL
jgi:hypothetical protein